MKNCMIDETRQVTDSLPEKETADATGASPSEPGFAGFTMKSGSTTFLVGLHFSESCKETLDDKLKRLIRKDVEADNF